MNHCNVAFISICVAARDLFSGRSGCILCHLLDLNQRLNAVLCGNLVDRLQGVSARRIRQCHHAFLVLSQKRTRRIHGCDQRAAVIEAVVAVVLELAAILNHEGHHRRAAARSRLPCLGPRNPVNCISIQAHVLHFLVANFPG